MTVGASRDVPSILLSALDQRLGAVAPHLLPGWSVTDERRPGWLAADLLPELAAACPDEPRPEHWLLLTAVAGAFPLASEVDDLARRCVLDSPSQIARYLLDHVLLDTRVGRLDLPMQVVTDQVVIDTDYCSRHDTHTGIQRVVRETLPRWRRHHRVLAVSNIQERSAYRTLTPREEARVFTFGRPVQADPVRSPIPTLVVPWQTTVVWPEVADPNTCLRLASLAQYSGNTVGLIAYDMIPILTTELRPFGEAGIFARYLSAVKHAHRVAGISNSATVEFRGFSQMLAAQGLNGPVVDEVELAEDVGALPSGSARSQNAPTRPLVLLTGRREPHKNLRASLHAAERLWSEGLDFEVVMLGGRGWDEVQLTDTMDRLKKAGHPLTTLGWVSDDEMWRRIRDASFVVFASLHEGYGLPISEALACGTPVVTSDYGSQREVAEKGGCLIVDPRDDVQLTDAMRTLISDPSALAVLRDQIFRRPRRTWDDYSHELWSFLVEGRVP